MPFLIDFLKAFGCADARCSLIFFIWSAKFLTFILLPHIEHFIISGILYFLPCRLACFFVIRLFMLFLLLLFRPPYFIAFRGMGYPSIFVLSFFEVFFQTSSFYQCQFLVLFMPEFTLPSSYIFRMWRKLPPFSDKTNINFWVALVDFS